MISMNTSYDCRSDHLCQHCLRSRLLEQTQNCELLYRDGLHGPCSQLGYLSRSILLHVSYSLKLYGQSRLQLPSRVPIYWMKKLYREVYLFCGSIDSETITIHENAVPICYGLNQDSSNSVTFNGGPPCSPTWPSRCYPKLCRRS